MTREDALTQVRKLLNMTTANGCTEAEAATAAGKAQKLMTKHSIAALDLGAAESEEDEEIRAWEDPLETMPSKLRQLWRGNLASALCRHNGAHVYWSRAGGKPTLAIQGRASDVTAVRYLYEFCIRETERLAKQHRGNGRTWMNNWRHGVVAGITQSLREAREAARNEYAAETGTALVVVDQALATLDQRTAEVTDWATKEFNLKQLAPGTKRYDHNARATGKRDGGTINVTGGGPALGGGSKRLT